jgi:hypothetical protein
MNRSRIKQTAIAALTCATVAGAIGIATVAAAPPNNGPTNHRAGPRDMPPGMPPPPALGRRGVPPTIISGPPLHSEMVVPTRSGNDFITVTQDSGTVKSVSGDRLTITEGTEEATYKTVTLAIPGDATIVRNGKRAELADLRMSDQVHVSQSPQDSFVFASDSDYRKSAFRRFRHLPRPPGAGGLPPGGPPGLGLLQAAPPRGGALR